MELSPGQVKAYDAAQAWLEACRVNRAETLKSKPFFFVGGYAGTGKSTIANKIVENIRKKYFGTFTGKAASVLKRKGVPAATIHSLVYTPLPIDAEKVKQLWKQKTEAKTDAERAGIQQQIKEALKPRFELNQDSELADADLLIVDEVSMVGEEMGRDLLSFKVPILVLGDPGQLPPITGEGFFTKDAPDVLLTEIHRQAAGNPIIAMATLARQGNKLKPGKYGTSEVVWRQGFNDHLLTTYDQIICGRNATRKATNARVRDFLGHLGVTPLAGEKVICLKNNRELGILNGTQWLVEKCEDQGMWVDLELQPYGEEARKEALALSAHPFDADFNNMQWYDRKRYEEFDFGYAITCHKSQGSQWGSVCVQDESWIFKADSAKWLYTALTRAEEKVMVIR